MLLSCTLATTLRTFPPFIFWVLFLKKNCFSISGGDLVNTQPLSSTNPLRPDALADKHLLFSCHTFYTTSQKCSMSLSLSISLLLLKKFQEESFSFYTICCGNMTLFFTAVESCLQGLTISLTNTLNMIKEATILEHGRGYFILLQIFHHHHHVVPLVRISLTLSRHFSQSFIASGRSSGLYPVSSHSCRMYVRAGRPAFAWPYVEVHRSTSLMSSSLRVWFV